MTAFREKGRSKLAKVFLPQKKIFHQKAKGEDHFSVLSERRKAILLMKNQLYLVSICAWKYSISRNQLKVVSLTFHLQNLLRISWFCMSAGNEIEYNKITTNLYN